MSDFFSNRKQGNNQHQTTATGSVDTDTVMDGAGSVESDNPLEFLEQDHDRTHETTDRINAPAQASRASVNPASEHPTEQTSNPRKQQRRRRSRGPRRFGVEVPGSDANGVLPVKRPAIPIDEILARRGRPEGYTAGSGGPQVIMKPDPYDALSAQDTQTTSGQSHLVDQAANPPQPNPPDSLRSTSTAEKVEADTASPDTDELTTSFDFLDSLDEEFSATRAVDADDTSNSHFDTTRVGTSQPDTQSAKAAGSSKLLKSLAVVLVSLGVILTAIDYLRNSSDSDTRDAAGRTPSAAPSTSLDTDSDFVSSRQSTQATPEEPAQELLLPSEISQPSELKTRTTNAIDEITALIDSGELDAAENKVTALDFSVYGYGQPEFDALSDRIGQLRLNSDASADDVSQIDAVDNTRAEATDDPVSQQSRSDNPAQQNLTAAQLLELEQFAEETARLRDEARQIAEQTRLARENAAEQKLQQQQELERIQQEQQAAELERVEQLQRQRDNVESQRLAEERRLAEVREQLQLEQQRAEAALKEIETRRIAEEARLLEQQQKVAEAQQLQQELTRRTSAEQARLQEERLAQEQARLEEERLAREQARLEEERLAQEQARREEERLAQEQARREEERLAQEQAGREEERLAQEQARREGERLAREQARLEQERLTREQRLEDERLAREQARLEQERLAENRRLEEERLALEQTRIEEQRLAQEFAAQQEAQRLAVLEQTRAREAAEAEQAAAVERQQAQARRRVAEAARLARQRRAEQTQQATDAVAEAARLAQQRRAEQAQQARDAAALERQQTLARQRERLRASVAEQQRRANENAAQQIPDTDAEVIVSDNASSRAAPVQPITDADIATVYRQFQALERAIESKDMDRVLALTERSSGKIGLFLQLFQNFDALDIRIGNVSSQPARAVVQSRLTIRSVTRDGVSRPPPSTYPAVTAISSQRDSNGEWSKIAW